MTFKHIKFEDSAICRSLEKLAREKGMIKNEEITKTAASTIKNNLIPTDNLIENIIRLSTGLKNIGLNKYSEELEQKLINFKKASLYDLTKETGDDLVDAAHPKGSHKLENIDSENAVVKTILDKHLDMVKMVEKKPTGKLASTKDILKAVKFVFAQQLTSLELEQDIKENLSKVIKLYNNIDSIISDRGDLSYLPGGRGLPYKSVSKHIKDLFNEEMTTDRIKEISKLIRKVKSFVSPGLTGGVSEEAWDIIEPLFDRFDPYFTKMLEDRHQIHNLEREGFNDEKVRNPVSTNVLTQEAKDLFYSIDSNIKSLESYKPLINTNARMNAQQKATELSWIDGQIKELQDIKNAGPNENTYSQLSKLFGPNGDITQYYKSRSWLKP